MNYVSKDILIVSCHGKEPEEVGHDHVHYILYCDFHTFLYMQAEFNVIDSGTIVLIRTILVKS